MPDIAQGAIGAFGALCDSTLAEEGLAELCAAAQDDAEGELGAACGGQSYGASTKVVLASGAAIPIADLKSGDKVLATNVKTGNIPLMHYNR